MKSFKNFFNPIISPRLIPGFFVLWYLANPHNIVADNGYSSILSIMGVMSIGWFMREIDIKKND